MKSEDRGVKLKPAMERVVTAAELSEHTSQDDCWFVVDGKVYDVTNWLAQHPGGGAVILGASADPSSSSAMFHAMHGNAERALENVEKTRRASLGCSSRATTRPRSLRRPSLC